PSLEQEIADALGDMNIDDLIAEEEKSHSAARIKSDKIIKGKVMDINGEDIFVNIGSRQDGVIGTDQFRDGELPAVGDEIEVVIEGVIPGEGLIRLSRQGAVQAAAWDTIQKGLKVEGRVTGFNKGGLDVDINGIRAFMPISQIALERIETEAMGEFVNQRLECEVTEVDRANSNVIVSRKILLQREVDAKAEELWKNIHEGMIVQGTVRSIMPYGAFVDIGGIDGLLHIKDMAHSRVEKPQDIVQLGQKLELKVISLDRENNRVGLGLKQNLADPWDSAAVNYPADSLVTGKVVKLMDFGAFVELEPGVEGLVPISELSFGRRIGHPREVLNVGDMVKLRVLKIEPENHRMSLSLKRIGDDPWVGAEVRWPAGSVAEGTVTRITEFGAFVSLGEGVEGLVHISQLSPKRVNSAHEVVREGQAVKAVVLEVDEQRRRISLSLKKLQEDAAGQAAAESQGTMDDLKRVNNTETKKSKKRKGGLDGGTARTPFGELRLG
ncbi:MAG TPA: S1 RNA-binding domain-containing protein, partial [Phycisphaerae bacterium]|nr:S1 RNA-binding domain-containing protein [Phycisphaerae bacterium]